jgi:hypothetical protein
MPLPEPDWLSLPETVLLVAKATGETEDRVRAALIDAALAGRITATGCWHLSTLLLRDPAKYFAAPPGDRQAVPASTWGNRIDWQQSRVGGYSLVRLKQAEIERWLGTTEPGKHAAALNDVPTSRSNAASAAPPAAGGRRKRGPAPGTLDRYGKADRALFPELRRIMRDEQVSVAAAATRLAEQGKVTGVGAPSSRAKRLAARYRREREN